MARKLFYSTTKDNLCGVKTIIRSVDEQDNNRYTPQKLYGSGQADG